MVQVDRERLRELVAASGKSARAVSLGAKLGATAVKDILSGKSRDPGASTISAIATELGVAMIEIMDAEPAASPSGVSESPAAPFVRTIGVRPILRQIPVMGDVAAGMWHEAVARELHEADEYLPVDVAGYERAQLYALRVVGTSMNRVYAPGRYLVIAPAHEAGVRWGDHVIVERRRSDLVEVTVKELVNEGGRMALWPRSDDPAHQKPIYVRGDDADQAAPRIIGVVIADYGRRQRPDTIEATLNIQEKDGWAE